MKVALYGEINFPVSPLRGVSTSVLSSRVSPYVLVGGAYADSEQSRRAANTVATGGSVPRWH
jgi:hypothetical protein